MYHFRVKVMGRSSGRGAAGAAAYRTGGRCPAAGMAYRVGGLLTDPRTETTYDYRAKGRIDANGFGVTHVEILAPKGARPWVFNLQELLNRVEAAEKRKDAQFFRELEISLPRELSPADQQKLVRAYVERMCVFKGMVAVIAHHNERASDGETNPHVHVLLTMRQLWPEDFGKKERAWNSKAYLRDLRESWAAMANEMLAARGFKTRLDHRSFKDRGLDLEPDTYVGPASARGFDGIIIEERKKVRAAAKARNRDRAVADPAWALDQLGRMQSTFTESDIARFLHRTADLGWDDGEFRRTMARILASPELMKVASDQKGPARYTTRAVFEAELSLSKTAERLAGRVSASADAIGLEGLSPQQAAAARTILAGADLTALEGVAGSGKTYLLARVRAAFEAQGYRVRGAALSAIVARDLGEAAGVPSQTLASLLKDLDRAKPYAPLARGDVLVIDEAGLIGARQLAAVLTHAERAGAKVVLVGDRRQLQAIEAGAAFRTIVDRHGAARLEDVRRQRAGWQQQATKALSSGRTDAALAAYLAKGAFEGRGTTREAMAALVARWKEGALVPGAQMMFAYRRADAEALNRLARAELQASGLLGIDRKIMVTVTEAIGDQLVERQEARHFAAGDRILFTRNDRALGVQNGAIGQILAIDRSGRMRIELPGRQTIDVDPRTYNHLDQGYARTIHATQGMTVERAFVLASECFDAQAAYVALTRHRDSVQVFYGRDAFPDEARLRAVLTRDRFKDITLDYPWLRSGEQTPPEWDFAPAAMSRYRSTREERREQARLRVVEERAEREARHRGPERE